jgi:hypothetical protein
MNDALTYAYNSKNAKIFRLRNLYAYMKINFKNVLPTIISSPSFNG